MPPAYNDYFYCSDGRVAGYTLGYCEELDWMGRLKIHGNSDVGSLLIKIC